MNAKFKNATKRITAVATSALMIASSANADLGNYPNNFVEDGSFMGQVVIGSSADSSAATSIINDLSTEFSGDSERVRITYRAKGSGDSIRVGTTNNDDDLNFGEGLSSTDSDEFDDSDLSSFLADGIVIDTDYEDDEYDYEQSIFPGDVTVNFGRSYDMDEETDVPELFLDVKGGTSLYTLHVDFKDTLIVADDVANEADEGLANSETIKIFGSTLTFDPSNDITDDGVLFASSNILTVNKGESVTVSDVDGNSYDVSVTGANSDDSSVTLDVNGVTKSVDEGTNTRIAGLDVYVDDVFVSNVGGDSAAVKLLLGSDEITIPIGAFTGWTEIEVDGDQLNGYEVRANLGNGGNWSALDDLEFRLVPEDMDNEVEYLRVGDSVSDPLFGTLTVDFQGSTQSEDDYDTVRVTSDSTDVDIEFVNREGDDISFTASEYNGTLIQAHEDFFSFDTATNLTAIGEDKLFILQEKSDATDFVTKIYEVSSVTVDEGDDIVKLKDLSDGSTSNYEDGDEVGSTGAYVRNINTTSDTFDLRTAATGGSNTSVDNTLYTDNDVRIVINSTANGITFTENMDTNIEETGDSVGTGSLTLSLTLDTDNDVLVNVASSINFTTAQDEDNDIEYGLSQMGSMYEMNVEDDNDFVLMSPSEEADYIVNFITGEVAPTESITVDASAADSERQSLIDADNEIVDSETLSVEAVEFDISSAVMASEVTGMEDMIVVGGPAVNQIARDLLGVSSYTMDQAGVDEGEAVIRYFSDSNSVLVYGYAAEDTEAAANKLNVGGLSGSEERI